MTATEPPRPFDAEFAEDTRSELAAKVDQALERLARTNVDKRELSRLHSLQCLLMPQQDGPDLAALLSMKQTMSDHVEWLETPAGRAETTPDVTSIYLDASASLGDLIACYPQARAIAASHPSP